MAPCRQKTIPKQMEISYAPDSGPLVRYIRTFLRTASSQLLLLSTIDQGPAVFVRGFSCAPRPFTGKCKLVSQAW